MPHYFKVFLHTLFQIRDFVFGQKRLLGFVGQRKDIAAAQYFVVAEFQQLGFEEFVPALNHVPFDGIEIIDEFGNLLCGNVVLSIVNEAFAHVEHDELAFEVGGTFVYGFDDAELRVEFDEVLQFALAVFDIDFALVEALEKRIAHLGHEFLRIQVFHLYGFQTFVFLNGFDGFVAQ